MSSHRSPSLNLGRGARTLPSSAYKNAGPAPAVLASAAAERAASLQRAGKAMVVAGFVITIVGVVLYCAVTFAAGMNADLGDILLSNAVSFGRATLAVLAFGSLVWLVGSFTYLRGAMDADEEAGEDAGPSAQ